MLLAALLASCLPQTPPFGPPNIGGATLLTNQGTAVLDVNRDSSPEFYSVGALGLNFLVSTDEDGSLLASGFMGWFGFAAWPAGTLPVVLGVGAGEVTGDGRDDLIVVSNSGHVLLFPNAGGHRLELGAFLPPISLEFFGPTLPLNPPFVKLCVPNVLVFDANQDGAGDILVASAPVDIWTGQTLPGHLRLYVSNGSGGFTTHTLGLTGNVVDTEWADVDGDGTPETIVCVVEQGAAGVFGYELFRAAFDSVQGLHFVGLPQALPPRVTSLAIGDVFGGPAPDFVLSLETAAGPEIQLIEGDGTGQLLTASWTNLVLPPNTTGKPAHIMSVKLADFDRDGSRDLVALRNFVVPAPTGSAASAQHADSELVFAMGPNLSTATMVRNGCNGFVNDTWSAHPVSHALPLLAVPDLLCVADWSRDDTPDLYVPSVLQVTPTTSVSKVLVWKNQTPPVPGSPGFYKLGNPSGGVAATPARAGFDGGVPRLGNAQFAATLSNVRAGSIAGLLWGQVGFPGLFQVLGVDVHVAPQVFGAATIAVGTGATDGFATHPLPVPNVPALVGDLGYFQWIYFDPQAAVWGASQATQVFLAP